MTAIPEQQTATSAKRVKHHAQGHLRAVGNKDKARKRPLVFVRVVNRCTNGLMLPCGEVISPGLHEVECYDDQAAGILAMVETKPELIAEARRVYMTAMARELQSDYLGGDWEGTLDELVELISAPNVEGLVGERLAVLLEKTAMSVEATFHELNGRDIKPLDSAERVPGSEHAEPQREELDAEVSKAATANAQALASALAIAFKPMTEALTAISTRLDTLEGKSSGGGGNNQQGGQRR